MIAAALVAPLVSFAADSDSQKAPNGLRVEKREFPAIKLRGYGVVSAEEYLDGNASSQLVIHCESVAKAKIVEAKYLSDLGLLPGVTTDSKANPNDALARRVVQGQGAISAARSGKDVYIKAAADALSVSPFSSNLDSSDITEKDAHVPMYLDRWDKYGFRFYYAPLTPPEDISAPPKPGPYSPQSDFDFALSSGNCGFVPWDSAFPTEQAEGIMKTPLWAWMVPQAEKNGVPLGINLETGVPCSLYNRYREEWTVRDPQYLGGFYGLLNTDEGIFSWNSIAGRDAQMAELQNTVRRYNNTDNIVNWLNPDGEMGHGAPDNLINYGPVADAGYQKFLKEKYGTVATVAKRWGADLASWHDVHVPEVAHFLGWNKDAVDLTGTWKTSHDAAPGADSAAAAFDDSAWPSIAAPGDAIGILLPRKPAVFRRHITIDPAWHAAHPKVWLYVMDLSDTRPNGHFPGTAGTQAFINGTEVTEANPYGEHGTEEHWGAYEVSAALKDGDNLVAIDVPQGFFNYRVYLSPQEPRNYPDLGPQLNAEWADFIDWGSWSRAEAVKRGAQMIRQVDPNRPITFMAPDSYADDIKSVCEDYGGVFHNTGYMAGVWADFMSMEMNSANMPTDEEPGSGAKTLQEFKGFLGRWSTEGIQGVDYFQHIGDIEWKSEIKDYFGQTLNLWHLMGKYHVPKAQLALFSSDRVDRLYSFPFHQDLREAGRRHGHWDVRLNELLMPLVDRDELFPHDFERGYADSYKVILDTNTLVMDPELVGQIEKWVRAGGIFITSVNSGRNTSIEKDTWPISKLTGYRVAAVDQPSRHLAPAEGQDFIANTQNWRNANAAGNTLEKASPDCTSLLNYADGTTAAGIRQVGKGYVITVGTSLGGGQMREFIGDICEWAKIPTIPATVPGVMLRHYVSNNGLYDIWAMWNTDNKKAVSTTLTINNGLKLDSAWDVKTGQSIPLTQTANGSTMPVNLDEWVTQVVMTPRHAITSAPADWFALQRGWWRTGSTDMGAPMPGYKARYTLDLQQDWAFQDLGTDPSEGAKLVTVPVARTPWEQRPLGVFNIAPHNGELHGMFRKTFTVPASWTSGPVTLWLTEWHGVGYLDHGQAYLDGQPISQKAIYGDDLKGAFKPGTTHTLAIEIWGSNPVVGTPASIWLNYRPDAHQHQDLAGDWQPAADGLTYTSTATMPGPYTGPALRRTVKLDEAHANQTAVLRVAATDSSIYGVIVNGTWISRFHHHVGSYFDLAITPYLKFGQDNQIVLFGGNGKHTLKQVSLEFYAKGMYP